MAPFGSDEVESEAIAARPVCVTPLAYTKVVPICVPPVKKVTVPDGHEPTLGEPANAGLAMLAVRLTVLPCAPNMGAAVRPTVVLAGVIENVTGADAL